MHVISILWLACMSCMKVLTLISWGPGLGIDREQVVGVYNSHMFPGSSALSKMQSCCHSKAL